MNMVAFLTSLITPFVGRVLISLGFGVVTYLGVDAILDTFISSISSYINGMDGVIYNVLALSGFIQAIGVLLGAMAARLSLIPLKRLQAIT